MIPWILLAVVYALACVAIHTLVQELNDDDPRKAWDWTDWVLLTVWPAIVVCLLLMRAGEFIDRMACANCERHGR